MTVARWVAVTAACAAVLSAVVLSAGESNARRADRTRAVEQRIDQFYARARQAEGRMHRAMLRDSLRGALGGREWPAESLLIVADPHMPAWRAALEATRARAVWTSAGRLRGGVRVAYVVLATDFGHQRGSSVILPDAFDGTTCVVVREVDAYSLTKEARARDDADTTIGPPPKDKDGFVDLYRPRWQDGTNLGACAFYAAFGPPGRAIRSWLDDVEFYQTAASNFWSSAEIMPRWYRSAWEGIEPDSVNERFAAYMERMLVTPNGPENAAVIRCASGRTEECPRVVVGDALAPDPERDPVERGMPDPTQRYVAYGHVSDRSYRDFRPRVLADMVRDVGVDRFRKIWTSAKPIDEAYTEVTGAPFAPAMQDYVRRSVGGGAWIGPTIQPRPVITALAIVGLLLVGVAARFTRYEHR